MSLPWWSKRDAEMYRALSQFPENLEGKFLRADDFRSHFRDFHGRPVQDILEALRGYGLEGYFKYQITLTPEYLKHGQALGKVTAALSKLQPEPSSPPNERNGLSKRVHAKVLAERPLTKGEASNLPDAAKRYLAFNLSNIDRTRLHEELAIYNDNSFIQPSRLVKSTQSERAKGSISNTSKLPPLNLNELRLKPDSYAKDKGILHLSPFHAIAIAGKAGVKRPSGQKYDQCWIMERLFKSEKTLKNGVELSVILNVHKSIVDKTTTKKIENAKAEINKKVARGSDLKNLLFIDGTKIKVDKSYL